MTPDESPIASLAVLQAVPWLALADAGVLAQMAAQSRMRKLDDRQCVALSGRAFHHLVVVASGRIELSQSSAAGKRRVIGLLGPGQVFGLIPVLDGESVIHDAHAQGSATVAMLPRASLLAGMQASHRLTLGVVNMLCQRSRLIYESLSDHSLLPLRGRIARSLLGLATAYGLAPIDGGEIAPDVHISQADLGDLLGVSRQNLNVELKKLERAGLLRMAYNHISLCDVAGLRQLLGAAVETTVATVGKLHD